MPPPVAASDQPKSMDVASPSENKEECCVCASSASYFGIGICNHKDMCFECFMKNRRLYNKMTCVFCKVSLPPLLIQTLFYNRILTIRQ